MRIGFLLVGAAALVARSLAGDAVVDALATTETTRPAAEAAWSISTSLLVEAATAAIAYGVVIAGAAWLAGPTRWAVAARRGLAPYLRDPRYAYGTLTVIVLVLLAWAPTPALRRVIPALSWSRCSRSASRLLQAPDRARVPRREPAESMGRATSGSPDR